MNDDWRHHPHYSIDPFPKIVPSLLNSADIFRYAQKGCLITEFDRAQLNPASYTMKLLGTRYWWERETNGLVRKEQNILDGTRVKIEKNSISYLFTREEFRLPQYMAARFNLHIRYVHKGILLGTGPLVDPGFAGSLLIPLHNLTDNDYHVRGGDSIIWVEFTKLSSHEYWTPDCGESGPSRERPEELIEFPQRKYRLNADEYLHKALVTASGIRSSYGVQSAFKGALDETRTDAIEAVEATKWIRRLGVWGGLVAIISIAVGVGTLVFAAFQLMQSAREMTTSVHERLYNIEQRVTEHGHALSGAADERAEIKDAIRRTHAEHSRETEVTDSRTDDNKQD